MDCRAVRRRRRRQVVAALWRAVQWAAARGRRRGSGEGAGWLWRQPVTATQRWWGPTVVLCRGRVALRTRRWQQAAAVVLHVAAWVVAGWRLLRSPAVGAWRVPGGPPDPALRLALPLAQLLLARSVIPLLLAMLPLLRPWLPEHGRPACPPRGLAAAAGGCAPGRWRAAGE